MFVCCSAAAEQPGPADGGGLCVGEPAGVHHPPRQECQHWTWHAHRHVQVRIFIIITIFCWSGSSPLFLVIFGAVINIVADMWHFLFRIRVSVPLTNGPGSGSCYFYNWPSRRQPNFSAYCLLKLHIRTSFPRIKVIKKSQNSKNQGFSYYGTIFAWW